MTQTQVIDQIATAILNLINSKPSAPTKAEVAVMIAAQIGNIDLQAPALEPSKRRRVRTIAELIEAMGGIEATAAWAGVGTAAVGDWTRNGGPGIPPGWHYRLDRVLSGRGFEVDPAVFEA